MTEKERLLDEIKSTKWTIGNVQRNISNNDSSNFYEEDKYSAQQRQKSYQISLAKLNETLKNLENEYRKYE